MAIGEVAASGQVELTWVNEPAATLLDLDVDRRSTSFDPPDDIREAAARAFDLGTTTHTMLESVWGATLTCRPIDPPRILLEFGRADHRALTPDFRGLSAVLDRLEGTYIFQMTAREPVRALWVAGDSDRILGDDVKQGWEIDRILQTIHPEDHDEYLRIVAEPSGTCIYRVFRPDGEIRTLTRSWCTTLGQHGDPIRNAVVFDITTRSRMLNELRRSNRDLEQFAAVAAHELQSPAKTISGLVGLVLEDLGTDSEAEPAVSLKLIRATADRMHTQVADLLRWARAIGEGPAREPVDLAILISDVVEFHALQLQEADAQIDVDDLPWVTGDVGQLRIVFNNLISNACKYRSSERRLRIRVSAMTVHGEVLVMVSDNGTGFDMSLAGDVFALFRRVHSDDEYPGTGMGLPISRRIVEAHGGSLTAQSTPALGTTFTVRLPLHTPT